MEPESVRQALLRHVPSDEREAGHVRRMLELVGDTAPFARSSFEPGHFTASLFVVSPERDALALIFHKKLGIWVQPGGHLESDDVSLEGAARREASEEIGVSRFVEDLGETPIFDVDVHLIPARPNEAAHHHFDVRFALTALSRDLVVSDEVADARWIPLADVITLSSDESVQRAVRKILARSAESTQPRSGPT